MNLPAFIKHRTFDAIAGAVLAIIAGGLLWFFGDAWTNASYDYLFAFADRPVTNRVVVIEMDNGSFANLNQTRGEPWSRELHAQLLDRLADDGCALVVLDCFFRNTNGTAADQHLAAALKRQRAAVLMAQQVKNEDGRFQQAEMLRPAKIFSDAVNDRLGVAFFTPDVDKIVRRHWPYPAPGPYPSLPETAAKLVGATLSDARQERWLRYYGPHGAWTKISYQFATNQPAGFYRNQIVFIGLQPADSIPNAEPDEFSTPYTRWTGAACGGVELNATAFLNLVNGDWLRRWSSQTELSLLIFFGVVLGAGLVSVRFSFAVGAALGIFLLVAAAAIALSIFSNFWFPWLLVVGAQIPVALGWAFAARLIHSARTQAELREAGLAPPKIPGFVLLQPPIGTGAYGSVWLARNRAGEWRAVKTVHLTKFLGNTDPFQREFNGVTKYQSVAGQYPELVRVDHVSEIRNGFFYYVMELGDSAVAGWEKNPALYQPRDLSRERASRPGGRLPVRECVRIGLQLTEVLERFHQNGLTHRDIKPSNILYVGGRLKFADLGLVSDLRAEEQTRTGVGTSGFMPPENPGTPQADIYSLGMVLYVLATGKAAAQFPDLATALLADEREAEDFLPLNEIILKACQPSPRDRYASTGALREALAILTAGK